MTNTPCVRDPSTAAVGVGTPLCPACGAHSDREIEQCLLHDQHLIYSDQDAPAASRLDEAHGSTFEAYRMFRCGDCRLEFAHPLVAPSERWYSALYGQLNLYPRERWEFAVVAESLKAADVTVDYGCGSGEFLMSVRDRVARAVGFDFSSEAVRCATGSGLEAHRIEPQGMPPRFDPPMLADHVTAFHVLEHLERPASLFQFARQVGAASATLWVAVPSDRRASRAYGESDALDSPPHHLSRWTPAALEALGRSQGWTMVAHAYEPLSTGVAVWEETRRLPMFGLLPTRWRPLERIARRALAAGVWISRRHRRTHASGFSQLACFRPADLS